MMLATGDIAAVDESNGRISVTANVMGLLGATPALPSYYSELQLQRRRLRDHSMAHFLNIFDHRALSFFYRSYRKYNPLIAFEREEQPGSDPFSRTLLSLSGFASAESSRLSFDRLALAPLLHHLAGSRRTAAGLGVVMRHVTGLDLDIIEATPTWMTLPLDAQSRLGKRTSRLGGADPHSGLGFVDGAVIGNAVIDIQHHYTVSVGPLRYAELLRFCDPDGPTATIAETCEFYTGIAYRPSLRLRIAATEIPPLQLAAPAAPAYLGRTTWLGAAGPAIRDDCRIPISLPTKSGKVRC
jgi:type VI secretion system protein ImpH